MKTTNLTSRLLAFTLLSISHTAMAEIEGMKFNSVMGSQRTLTGSEAKAINPRLSQPLDIIVSAGLDRKLRLSWHKDGVKVNEVTTGIIGVSDRLTFEGKEFYGKTVAISAPSADGDYTLRAELLAIDNSVVGSWQIPVEIDTQAPAGDVSNFRYAIKANGGSLESFSPLNYGLLSLSGLSDVGSGLKSADFLLKTDGTENILSTIPAQLDLENSTANLTSFPSGTMPDVRSWYNISFRVFDAAGNYTDFNHRSFLDKGSYTRPVLSDIYDTATSSWVPYTPGMIINNNPLKVRYRWPYTDTLEYNGDFGISYYQYREGDWVYREFTKSYPVASGYFGTIAKSGIYAYTYYGDASFTYADGVDRNPIQQTTTVEWFDDEGNSGGRSVSTGKPQHFIKLRLHSEAMNYEQLAQVANNGGCIIPAGETWCEVAIDRTLDSGFGYAPHAYTVKSSVNGVADGRFSAHFAYWYTYWDFIAPTIESISVADDTVTVNVYDTNTTADWRAHLWKTEIFRLQSSLGGEISPDSWVITGQGKHRIQFKLNKLPNGNQDVTFYAQDTYGNRVTQTVLTNYNNDIAAPVLSLISPTGSAISSGSTINGLESLRIRMTDASEASITSVTLTGGAANDSVYVSTNSLGGNLYDLNYPRLFPSLEANESYTINVNASDIAGNASSLTSSFMYMPPNLMKVGSLTSLPINTKIEDSNGKPITSIETGILRTVEGQIAAGPQQAFITLRSDAQLAVIILGNILQPGETKEISIQPDITGNIIIPVYPAQNGQNGNASFMVDIPQITSNL